MWAMHQRITEWPEPHRPSLQNPNEHITVPEDAMQIDLVPGSPPSGGYENIVTAMDVFSRYLFAYPTSNQDAKMIAKIIVNIITKQAYLPTTLISDKGTAFMSHVIKEVGSGRRPWHYSTARHYKARSNNWAARAISLVNQASTQRWDWRTKIIVAQIRQHCSP